MRMTPIAETREFYVEVDSFTSTGADDRWIEMTGALATPVRRRSGDAPMRELTVQKVGKPAQTLKYREDEAEEMERDRRDFLLGGFSVEVSRRREWVAHPSPASVAESEVLLEEWPEHGAWYEVGRTEPETGGVIGSLYAPAYADGSLPTAEDIGEIEVRFEDA